MGLCVVFLLLPLTSAAEVLDVDFYGNYSWFNAPPAWTDSDNIIGQWMLKNKGINMIYRGPGGNADEKLNLMVATGELPDVIMMDRNDQWKQLIDLGVFVELDDYIAKYDGYRSVVDERTWCIRAVMSWRGPSQRPARLAHRCAGSRDVPAQYRPHRV